MYVIWKISDRNRNRDTSQPMDPISGAKTSLSVLIPAPLEIDSSYKEIKGEFSKHDN